MRRSAFETGSPAVARASRGRSLWALLSVVAGFGLFGVVVWLAYQDTSLGPPTGEPPLIKAAADRIKMPPDEAEEEEARESGAVGRLWSDAERADLPERLLPPPEAPLSPEAVANAGVSEEQAPSAAAEVAESDPSRASEGGSSDPVTGEGATAALPAETPETPPAQGGHLTDAEAALDRLLAEVAALSEEPPTPPAAPTGATNEPEAAGPPSRSPPAAAATPTPERPSSPEEDDSPAGANQEPPATAGPEIRHASALTPPVEPGPSGTDAAGATAAVAPAEAAQVAAVDDRFRIQLAAVRDEADARRAWDDLAGGLGPVLSGVRPFFERADTADGTFYRVQIGPFASQEPAESLCEQLKQHNASCFVIRR
jgi:SPOR domain